MIGVRKRLPASRQILRRYFPALEIAFQLLSIKTPPPSGPHPPPRNMKPRNVEAIFLFYVEVWQHWAVVKKMVEIGILGEGCI